jgi:hypothetical protein
MALDQSVDGDTFQEMLDAKESMYDTMGVNQHHDAVTGTGKQAVANDYAFRIFKSMQINNQPYSEIISEAA